MTNRSKSAKKPRLRCLDLSFEGRNDVKHNGLDNGKRPHGGYRGCKKHPPTPFSQDKSRDYHRKLREDIDRLFEEEMLEVHGTPSWTLEASREITHSGESPLLLHKFLSPTRDEHQFVRLSRSAYTNPDKCQPPMSRDGVAYYRPNRTHQYLTATELKDQSQNEVNLKYGRPTRTTLLRARQRTNSVPVNSYEVRREKMIREEELRTNCVYTNPKEFLQEVHGSTNGETFHSFITGARYNRAHCIDAKSLTLYGVYMPRNNPNACFVTGANKLRDIYDVPSAPPDSPRSDVDDISSPLTPRRPTTAPNYGRRPTSMTGTQPKQAWGDGESHIDRPNDCRVYEELIFWPTGLSVKGKSLGVSLKRTNSMPKLDAKLPSVQGVSVERIRKSQDPVEETSLVNQPPPSPMAMSTKDAGAEKTDIIIQEKTKQVEELKKEATPKKPKPILVDRSVNVPSVSGDSHLWNDEPFIKISGCSMAQVKVSPDSESSKAVSFKKQEEETEEREQEPETVEPATKVDPEQVVEIDHDKMENADADIETTTATTKEIDVELPSDTDGASVEAREASSMPSNSLPAALEGNDLIIDTLSNQSQGDVPTEENCSNTDNEQVGEENVTFFITEDEEKKEIISADDDPKNTVTQIKGDDGDEIAPSLGQADQMAIPQVTIEEASVTEGSEGADDLEALDGSTEDDIVPGNNSKDDNSEVYKPDDSQEAEEIVD